MEDFYKMAKGTIIKHTRKAGAFVNGELHAGEEGARCNFRYMVVFAQRHDSGNKCVGVGDMAESEYATNGGPGKVDTAVNAEQLGGVAANLYATKTFANSAASTAVSAVIDASPGTLDTLNELAAALGDDPNLPLPLPLPWRAKPQPLIFTTRVTSTPETLLRHECRQTLPQHCKRAAWPRLAILQ